MWGIFFYICVDKTGNSVINYAEYPVICKMYFSGINLILENN